MNIYQEMIDDLHKSSFWYNGAIAENGKYTLYAVGDIRVSEDDDDDADFMNDYQALEYADTKNWTDKDLAKFRWESNNWFEIVDDENNSIEVFYDYDEAIKGLESLIDVDYVVCKR